jgi:magnesium chelatase accessory protein
MNRRLEWDRDGADWPHRDASRFVMAGGVRWHVQQMGRGPPALLVHGTGASSHSWRDVAPLLAEDFTVYAIDLPGHGFSSMPGPDGLSLPGMAAGLDALLGVLDARPVLAVGHSAGAAILVRMALDGRIAPRLLVSVNGALLPLHGRTRLFLPAARMLAGCGLAPRLFAFLAGDRAGVERLLRGTGSSIDAEGVRLYGRLVHNPGHVAGALGMMANWDLDRLAADLPRLAVPLLLIAGRNDRTIAPAAALRLRERIPGAVVELLPGLGHLAHEEQPRAVAELILRRFHAQAERLALPA